MQVGTVPNHDAATLAWDMLNIATASPITKAARSAGAVRVVSGPDLQSLLVQGGKVCISITPVGWESVCL